MNVSDAVIDGQASVHPGKETLDEVADKERFFRVNFLTLLWSCFRGPLFIAETKTDYFEVFISHFTR